MFNSKMMQYDLGENIDSTINYYIKNIIMKNVLTIEDDEELLNNVYCKKCKNYKNYKSYLINYKNELELYNPLLIELPIMNNIFGFRQYENKRYISLMHNDITKKFFKKLDNFVYDIFFKTNVEKKNQNCMTKILNKFCKPKKPKKNTRFVSLQINIIHNQRTNQPKIDLYYGNIKLNVTYDNIKELMSPSNIKCVVHIMGIWRLKKEYGITLKLVQARF